MVNSADKRFGQRNVTIHFMPSISLAFAIEIGPVALALLVAFLSGSVILNVLKEELPQAHKSRFRAFALVVSQVESAGKKSMDFFVWQGGVAGVSNGMPFACGTISSCKRMGPPRYAPCKGSWGFERHVARQRNGIGL